MTKDQILSEAMALEPHERDEVAEALWQSVVSTELSPEQLAEVRRRIAAIDNGEPTLPGEQVMEEMRKRFER